jgi:hypothetical protein
MQLLDSRQRVMLILHGQNERGLGSFYQFESILLFGGSRCGIHCGGDSRPHRIDLKRSGTMPNVLILRTLLLLHLILVIAA